MQFKLAKTYSYWWPVTVRVPDPEDPGKYVEQKLKVLLEPLPQDEVIAAQEESAALTTMRAVTEHGVRHMLRVVQGWDGVVDEHGKHVPFSPELLEQALQHSWFRAAIGKALTESQNGEAPRLGN
ncbi:hypothetical protein H4P12_08460 [Paracoccus sp. 11-3]|uniref:Tail assembly chaperone n=1 Tax=Paracoccus amoyensis TaxID=2760093 RepID=A0A926JDB1_9RHOB|nr:hypothetical protein [Paracoccus amoyensis]MBC9246743.1 hypothetical protein [Paracoccus amoyensis]